MSEANPFELLQSIAQASIAQAAGLPAQADVQQFWTGVAFKFAGFSLVAAMNDVSEIISVPALTKLPGVKPWVLGVANVRGRLIPVMDLANFSQHDASQKKLSDQRLLIVEEQDVLNGLVVDVVEGIQHFSTDDFVQDQEQAPAIFAPFVAGSYSKDQQLWTVINVRQLITSAQFMQVAV